MQETRRQRLQSVIQQELAMAVRDLKDPRVPVITITAVEVTQEGDQATVFVSILGAGHGIEGGTDAMTQARMKDCLDGLKSATGVLRKHLARVLTVRHIPGLVFREDRGLDNANRVYDLLKKIGSEPEKPEES